MKTLITALALTLSAAAGIASAQSSAPAPDTKQGQAQSNPGRTRAEVIAEVIEARKNGTLIETEADMDVAQTRKQTAK